MSELATNTTNANAGINHTDINKTQVYSSFSHAAKFLAGLVAVDYFFANEIIQCLPLPSRSALSSASKTSDQQQCFHLLVALSASLRDGHSCLPLNEVANKRWFVGELSQVPFNLGEQEQPAINNGFLFENAIILTALLEQIGLAEDAQQPIVFNNGRLYLRRYYQFEQELKQAVASRRMIEEISLNQAETQTSLIKNIITQLFPDSTSNNLVSRSATYADKDEDIDWQALAVANAVNKDFAIIAGGPGTGKTYTVTKLLAALIMLALENTKNTSEGANTPRISLVAPTGKAAQRLSESIINAVQGFRGSIDDDVLDLIPESAQTLHRLLGVIPEQVNFRHHQDNLLAVDILLIDEVSMVDLPMMTRIFRALPAHTKVILLGDADQLPSVAVGSVLADFAPRPHPGFSAINHQYLTQVTGFKSLTKQSDNVERAEQYPNQYSAADCATFLMKSRRFDGKGGIGRVANYVINGQYKESWQLLKESSTETIENEGQIANDQSKQLTLLTGAIESWLTPLVSQYYQGLCECKNVADAFSLLAKFRILSSTRKGPQGVENLNALVIEILRNKGLIPYKQFSSTRDLYPTQPIMISENDYRLGVYNGDIGLLWRNSQGHLMAVFENGSGEYEWIMPSRLPKFETVYAMTIHKTQGSEFEHVAMVLPEQKDNKLLSRELLYTGITRAKSKLSIASSERIWKSGVSQQVIRYSGLALD
jgi:exodeoxyribonuclease V alpha subunit